MTPRDRGTSTTVRSELHQACAGSCRLQVQVVRDLHDRRVRLVLDGVLEPATHELLFGVLAAEQSPGRTLVVDAAGLAAVSVDSIATLGRYRAELLAAGTTLVLRGVRVEMLQRSAGVDHTVLRFRARTPASRPFPIRAAAG